MAKRPDHPAKKQKPGARISRFGHVRSAQPATRADVFKLRRHPSKQPVTLAPVPPPADSSDA